MTQAIPSQYLQLVTHEVEKYQCLKTANQALAQQVSILEERSVQDQEALLKCNAKFHAFETRMNAVYQTAQDQLAENTQTLKRLETENSVLQEKIAQLNQQHEIDTALLQRIESERENALNQCRDLQARVSEDEQIMATQKARLLEAEFRESLLENRLLAKELRAAGSMAFATPSTWTDLCLGLAASGFDFNNNVPYAFVHIAENNAIQKARYEQESPAISHEHWNQLERSILENMHHLQQATLFETQAEAPNWKKLRKFLGGWHLERHLDLCTQRFTQKPRDLQFLVDTEHNTPYCQWLLPNIDQSAMTS